VGTVGLAYGRGHVRVPQLPGSTVVLPRDEPPLADLPGALREALASPIGCAPLASLARGARDVVISVCDGTRAQPRREVLPALLDVLQSAAPNAVVTLLIATGTHRANTAKELDDMLGPAVLARVQVVNHDARDDSSLADLGVVGAGVPLSLNRRWVDADLRITTGFVEPHFFAGFSGGPKMVCPGLAGLSTVMVLHDAQRIGDPRSTWGVLDDNPVHTDIRACAAAAPPHLAIDVLLDRDKRITHVFAGELFAMHRLATAQAKQVAMREVDNAFDVVVTTNSGFPLDQNLYQAVKGLTAAERIVKPGGTIVLAAECADGLPDHGPFGELLRESTSAADLMDLLRRPGFSRADQWQVQVLARVLAQARVVAFAGGLTLEQLRTAHIEKADDLAAAISSAARAAGPHARVCYLPEGPQTIPYLADRATAPA